MRAGRMRHLVDIEANTGTQDPATGEIIAAWSPFARNQPAEIRALSGREVMAAQQEAGAVDTQINMRLLHGVTSAMRIRHPASGTIYDIKTVLADPTLERYMQILAQSGVNAG